MNTITSRVAVLQKRTELTDDKILTALAEYEDYTGTSLQTGGIYYAQVLRVLTGPEDAVVPTVVALKHAAHHAAHPPLFGANVVMARYACLANTTEE